MTIPNAVAKVLIPIFIVGGGMGVYSFLDKNGPEAPKEAPIQVFTTVETMIAKPSSHQVMVKSRGSMVARQSSQIASQVSGRIVHVADAFEVGAVFAEGELMLQIETADFETAVVTAKAQAADAAVALKSEESRSRQAEREWKKLGGDRIPDPLVLRQPQLAAAQARLRSAEAAVVKAERDLARTEIRAPYACRIIRRSADLGSLASPGLMLAEIESADDFQVQLPVSLDDYVYLPQKPDVLETSAVSLRAKALGSSAIWKGFALRTEGLVDQSTRSINVIANVSGVDESGQHSAMSGLFVEAELTGRSIEGVVLVPREAFVDRTRLILLTDEKTLTFRDVTVLRYEEKVALVQSGLSSGDRVVITSLESPVEGQKVEVAQ